MNPDQFWTSQDGQILTVKNKDERTVDADPRVLAAASRRVRVSQSAPGGAQVHRAQFDGPHRHRNARRTGRRGWRATALELEADAFIYDPSFPNAPYWKKLHARRVRPSAGSIYAPDGAPSFRPRKSGTRCKENRLKLPNTISIDSLGRVFLTPHQVSYTLSRELQRAQISSGWSAGTPGATFSTRCRSGTRPRRSPFRRTRAFSRAARCI